MTREEFIKHMVKEGHSGRTILKELREIGYSIGNDKFYELVREYRKSEQVKEEVIKEYVRLGLSGREIGERLRQKEFAISNDKLYGMINKHRRYICIKDNILEYPERDLEFGIGYYSLPKSKIKELAENRFFGIYSICEEFIANIYIGQNREEELAFSKLKYLYHLILTKTIKLKLREGCCEEGTELENFTLQLAWKYDNEYVFDERNLCKKFLYDILEILHDKNCLEDEEVLEEWLKYLEKYKREAEE